MRAAARVRRSSARRTWARTWSGRARAAVAARVARGAAGGPDDGNAIVEFLGVALVLLVPLVYLVLVLGRLQAAAFAVDGAAREAVRAVLAAPATGADPDAAARAAVGIALADQGFVPDDDTLLLTCVPACDRPGAEVVAHVELGVDLPLVPAFLREAVPLRVPTAATARGEVGTLEAAP